MQENPIKRKSHHRAPRNINLMNHHPSPKLQNQYENVSEQQNNPEMHNQNEQNKIGHIVHIYPSQHTTQLEYKKRTRKQKEDQSLLACSQNINEEQFSQEPNRPQTPQPQDPDSMDNHSYLLLPKMRKNQSQPIPEIGSIKKQQLLKGLIQNNSGGRYSKILEPDNQKQYVDISVSPQKSHNNFALSLMGIKRAKANKSCLEAHRPNLRNSMMEIERQIDQDMTPYKTHKLERRYSNSTNNKKYRIRKDSDVEIYEHAEYPFRADDIKYLKKQIETTVKEKWEIRNLNYAQYHDKKQRKSHKKLRNSDIHEDYQPRQQEAKKYYLQLQQPTTVRSFKINHKSTLSHLKSLAIIDQHTLNKKLWIQIPPFFTNPPQQFIKLAEGALIQNSVLHSQACYLFSSMQIPIENLSIKKYSNCLVIVNANLSIIWHLNTETTPLSHKHYAYTNKGKKYFGSWKSKYFDQGVKEGMGLQWVPQKYIYYGQFQNNKRHGFGIMRTSKQQINIGFWKKGKLLHFGIEKNLY